MLADAYVRFRRRTGDARIRLEAAGYLAPVQRSRISSDVRRDARQGGPARTSSRYRGALDRAGKLAFLRGLDVLSVPATYDEPKGMFLLEAMASGVPVVQPRRGGFTEIVERTGGGLLVEPDDPDALADGLYALWSNRALRDDAGAARVRRRARPLHHRAVGRPAARGLRRVLSRATLNESVA